IFKSSRENYGSPRIYNALKNLGFVTSVETVARYMRDLNLVSKTVKKFRVSTTNSNHNHRVSSNLLKQEFEGYNPGEVILGDITYIPTSEGWLYLSAVLDLGSREIAGWHMSATLESSSTVKALEMAATRTKITPETIFHSDRGVQYASNEFRQVLNYYGIKQSMSGRGNCYDNSPMESFFHTLKVELVHHENFQTRKEAELKIFEWIEVYYNRERLHSSIGYKNPFEYKCNYFQNHS
ncbi:MAG: IS3 family transposase, partial [Nitrospinota bacterium]